jgi:hypothetical protein
VWRECHYLIKEPGHGGITITSGVEEMSLPNFRRVSHDSITIISGVEEIPLKFLLLNSEESHKR